MSTPYPQQPAYTVQQPTVHYTTGPYYPPAPGTQQTYGYEPDAAIRERAMVPAPPQSAIASWFDYSNSSYIKGLLVGAGAALLVTHPTVQTAVVKGAVAAWTAVVGGIEEIKERVRDARAEKSMT
jgi:hypothetical protein